MDYTVINSAVDAELNGTTLDPAEYGRPAKAGFITATALFLFAVYFTVAWKFISNVRDHLKVKPGDCLATAGLLLATGFAVACNNNIEAGEHVLNRDYGTLAAELLYDCSLLCAKLSLLCFHWSISDWIESRSRMLKWASIVLAGVIGLYHFASFFAFLFQAQPISTWLDGGLIFSRIDVRGLMIATSVLDILTLIAVLAVTAPILIWQWSSQQHQFFKSRIIATIACGLLSFPLTLARTPILAHSTRPLALPVISLLILTLLLLSTLFLHPSGHLTTAPSASTIEEISKMDHQHWRTPSDLPYLQDRGRPRTRSRGHSGTDFGSINSHTRLFPGRERVDRSRTPDPSSYFGTGDKIEIQVQYEVTRTVEERKGRIREQDAEKGLEVRRTKM